MANELVKLDKTDRIILTELDQNCRIPLTLLAKKARKSRQSVEYRINQLVQQGVITKFNTSINLHKIGYKIYKVFFRIKNKPIQVKKFLAHLRAVPEVWWLGETDGQWDIILAVFFKKDTEFFKFKNKLISDYSSIIIETYGTTHIDIRQYPKTYFLEEPLKPKILVGETEDNKLDGLDIEILKNLVNDARIQTIRLAQKTGSTPMIVKGRIKKMEKKGIIVQYRISVDLEKLGLELYKAMIQLEKYNEENEKKLFEYVEKIPNAVYFIRDMWRIELEFVTKNFSEYNRIVNSLKQEFSDIIRNVESLHLKTDEWTIGFENLGQKIKEA